MTDVFISHVEEDAADALDIADALEAAGYSTWCYERDSVPGPSYLVQTGSAVEQSRAVVVLISRHSLGSRQVTVEIVRGHETEKAFIPVLVGISHVDFTNRQPEWREAMGAATSIMVPREGVATIVSRIVDGLHALGVEPSGVPPDHRALMPSVRRRRGVLATVARRPTWQKVLAAALALCGLLALAVVLTATLLSSPEPSAGPTPADTPTAAPSSPAPSAGSSSTPAPSGGPRLNTTVGEAQVSDVSLADEFCPPADFPGECEKPSANKFLIVTLTGAGGAHLTIGLTQQSNESYVAHGGDMYMPSTVADEYQGVVRIVYAGAPASLAGEKVTLAWPDGQRVTVRVSK